MLFSTLVKSFDKAVVAVALTVVSACSVTFSDKLSALNSPVTTNFVPFGV